MNGKKQARLRRAQKARAKIYRHEAFRLCVFRTPRHIYAQIIAPEGDRVVASASTVEPSVRTELKNGGNADAAKVIGKLIAVRAVEHGVSEVAFDRSGFRFHGRVKALAESAREAGLKF